MGSSVRRAVVALAIMMVMVISALPAGAGGRATDRALAAQPDHDYYTVKLVDPAVASYMGGIRGIPRTQPRVGKINLRWEGARRYQDYLAGRRQDYKRFLRANAPRASVERELSVVFNGLVVKLNGENPRTLAQGPGAAAVSKSFLVRPAMNISTGLINADDLWALAPDGPANAGSGIKVGIIDTGIDLTNPFLSDTGYPFVSTTNACGPFTKPGGANVNNKVIVCRFFVSGLPAAAPISPFELVEFDHGTHVSGTVAGNYNTDNATVAGTTVQIDDLSGVAPRALLGDYNVFPGFGVGRVIFGGSAFSHDIADALEAAVKDGMDVVNMSLGGGVQGPHDFLADATNATVDAGVVAAVAAGNSGPALGTIESPGSAAKALTAGASTNPHFVGIPVTFDTTTIPAALGEFGTFDPSVTAPLANWNNTAAGAGNTLATRACSAATVSHAGQIVIIDRGTCTFTTKVRNAQNAGAGGVLVVNSVAGDPTAMAHDGTSPKPTIPAAMVGLSNRSTLRTAADANTSATVDGTTPQEFVTTNADIIAGFSSRGPTPFTYLIKPDVTAPGVNVLSSVFEGEFAFFQGTSMATPHVAGSAALLKFLHPTWSPDDIKSALVNTAKRPVFIPLQPASLVRGGGRIDLAAANATPLLFNPASVSFGFWGGNKPVSATVGVGVKNVSGASQSCTVDVTDPSGANVTTNSSLLEVAAEASTTLSVAINAGRANQTGSGDYTGDIVVDCDGLGTGTDLKVPWFVRIDREGKP